MKLSDFKKSVNSLIRDATSDLSIPIVAADLQEPIVRPSIKTFVDAGRAGRYNADCACRTIHTDIYFFAGDRYRPYAANMDMQDRIAWAFLSGIYVGEDIYIPLLEDVEFTTEDSVLHAQFDVQVFERIDDDSGMEPMEILKMEV